MISFLITSKNEPYLEHTINSICENAVTEHEILAEEDDGRGQRAMLNTLARKAKGDILCKVDAHCSFGYEFDRILLEDIDEKTIIAPQLFPLDGERWEVNHHNPMSNFACDSKLVMQHVPSSKGHVTETMVMQGSFFMVHKDFYFSANLCDESLGSWGSQGCELGLKGWYNGAKCLISKKTYYGHVFRHSDKDFPYRRNKKDIENTYNQFTKQYLNSDIGWLVRKFNYPCDWTQDKVTALCNTNQSTK